MRHTSLATYVLLRGIVLLVRVANRDVQHPVLRTLLAPTRCEPASAVSIHSWLS